MHKVPDYIFITAKDDIQIDWDPIARANTVQHLSVFGFLHPHTPGTKADNTRKVTQIEWAYTPRSAWDNTPPAPGPMWNRPDNDVDDGWMQYLSDTHDGYLDEPIPARLAPRVWKNIPMYGFKILDTVFRYRGNKLFRIQDPRGIEFEISAQSLFGIIQEGSIVNGEIMSPCYWKANKMLVVA